jgi:hypothetical protein
MFWKLFYTSLYAMQNPTLTWSEGFLNSLHIFLFYSTTKSYNETT